jgi:hypothetical protein
MRIKVKDYYGNPDYYSVMPQAIFDSLETAYLDGQEFTDVDKEQFDKMVWDYQIKMDK